MKRYNALNARMPVGTRRNMPSLSMQSRAAFRLNKPACALLGLELGSSIELFYDERNHDWYIARAEQNGLNLTKAKHGTLAFHSVRLHQEIVASMPEDVRVESGKFAIVDEVKKIEGVKAYPIVTRPGGQ